MGSRHWAPSMGPGVGTSHGHGIEYGDQAWGHPVGTSCGVHPWGLPMAVGMWGRGSRAGGQKCHPSPPPSHCRPGDPGLGDKGNIMMGVLGCSGWGLLRAAQTLPSPWAGFAISFSARLYFLPKASSCHLQTLLPPAAVSASSHSLPLLTVVPLLDGKCHRRVFGHPPPPPCWVAAGPMHVCALCTRAAAEGTPQHLCAPVWALRPSRCPSRQGCAASPAPSDAVPGIA